MACHMFGTGRPWLRCGIRDANFVAAIAQKCEKKIYSLIMQSRDMEKGRTISICYVITDEHYQWCTLFLRSPIGARMYTTTPYIAHVSIYFEEVLIFVHGITKVLGLHL